MGYSLMKLLNQKVNFLKLFIIKNKLLIILKLSFLKIL